MIERAHFDSKLFFFFFAEWNRNLARRYAKNFTELEVSRRKFGVLEEFRSEANCMGAGRGVGEFAVLSCERCYFVLLPLLQAAVCFAAIPVEQLVF